MGRQTGIRAALSLGAFAVPLGFYWLGGGGFERGFGLAFASAYGVVAAWLAWMFSGGLDA